MWEKAMNKAELRALQEITDLWEANARLRAEVERLRAALELVTAYAPAIHFLLELKDMERCRGELQEIADSLRLYSQSALNSSTGQKQNAPVAGGAP